MDNSQWPCYPRQQSQSALHTDRLVISDLLDGLTSGDFWLKAVKDMLLHATCCVRDRTRAHARRERDANDTKQQAIIANKG